MQSFPFLILNPTREVNIIAPLSLFNSKKFLVITKPDKRSGVVILDYVNRMITILGDTSKFVQLSSVDTHDFIISIEAKFPKLFIKK